MSRITKFNPILNVNNVIKLYLKINNALLCAQYYYLNFIINIAGL